MDKLTVEALREQYASLYYFDEDLNAAHAEEWLKAKENEIIRTQLLLEMVFVNKLQTVGRWYEWVASHKGKFDEERFYNEITNLQAITDPFGNIHPWGMFFTPEDFDIYKTFYDELFQTEIID